MNIDHPPSSNIIVSSPGIFILEEETVSDSLDSFKQAVYAVHARVQSPLGMIFVSALSAAATCTQGLIDVMCPGGGCSPVSLYVVVGANSGERKTSTDRQFTRCISDFEHEKNKKFNFNKGSKAAAQDIWKAQLHALKKSLNKAITKSDLATVSKLEKRLTEHYNNEPIAQASFRILFEDTTMPALLRELAATCKNACLNSSEGGILLGRASGEYLLYLNKLWDGDELRVDRISHESFTVKNVRISLSLMTQEALLKRFVNRRDSFAKISGFLARCLTISPRSTQGNRVQLNSAQQDASNKKYIDWFHDRQIHLLSQTEKQKEGTKQLISFSPEAAKIWNNFYKLVEHELKENGALADIRDFASKISNNMSRIAAVLHCFCGQKGDIKAEIAQFSVDLCMIFIMEFKNIFGIKDPIQQAHENARLLHKFIYEKLQYHPRPGAGKRWLCQYGPCRLSADFDAAVAILCQQNIAYVENDGVRGSYSVFLKSTGFNRVHAPSPHFNAPASDAWATLLQTTHSIKS